MQPCLEPNLCQASLRAERLQLESAPHTTCLRLLPVLPLTLTKMELLLQEPVVDLAAMAEVAKRDASLAAQLLLLANLDREESDRFYRIEDCLVQVGIAVLQQLIRQRPPLVPSDWRCGGLLNHSRLTALAAEAIALQVPGVDPEKAYLAGLVHLFPELVFLQTGVDKRDEIASGSEEWPLPAFAWEVIRWFKHPFAVSRHRNLLCEVVLAACEWVGHAAGPESPAQPTAQARQYWARRGPRLNSHLTKPR